MTDAERAEEIARRIISDMMKKGQKFSYPSLAISNLTDEFIPALTRTRQEAEAQTWEKAAKAAENVLPKESIGGQHEIGYLEASVQIATTLRRHGKEGK